MLQGHNERLHPDELLTSHEVGELLQAVPSSVVKWINDGLLPAFRTPGGHRRIRVSDLVAFLRHHRMFIPESLRNLGGAPLRVLLVDDDKKVLSALSRGMKSYRDRVSLTVVSSGVEALVRVGAEKPDILVIDVHMPEMDGLQVCSHLRRMPQQKTAVVVMTGKYSRELERRCRELGAHAVITKPFTATKLVETLIELRAPSRKTA